MRRILGAAAAMLIAGQVSAQTADSAGPQPQQNVRQNPCDAPEYRAFDFWIGEWEVFTQDGSKAGENSIRREEYGCLLVERWTGASGSTGQSYNFYDPGMKKFRQVWVSIGATIDYAGDLNEDNQMVLEGDIQYHNGSSAPFRGTWTAKDDGSVHQYFQQYNAQTEQWDDWFYGIYKKKSAE